MIWRYSKAMLLLGIFTSMLHKDTSALSCDWSYGFGKLKGYIPGDPKVVSISYGAGECQKQCISQTAFICAAVNYRVSDGLCELLAENNQTASVMEPFDGSWLYFIRPLCAGIWLPWTAEKGKYITTGSFFQSTTDSLKDCMTICLRDPSDGDECKAINLKTSEANNNCKFRSGRIDDVGVLSASSDSFQYFNRPIWYLESSPSSASAIIKNQGTIGTYLHIFTDLTIPISGYLVAWQYYMKTASQCTTFASIWRPDGEDDYILVSNTLLSPEETSIEGVRFQYIQNETIRVQLHDVLAVYVNRTPGCDKPIASVNPNAGVETTISITNSRKLEINTTRSSTENPGLGTTRRKATPALKAYVSAYLSLDGTPQTYHNTSLSSGQIWLKLPPPLTTEESVVVAGYKVICSTDDNLSSLVPCYDSLVPVNSRDVLLNLPDVTRTFHVSVQVARNFNDVELLDDKYSPASSAFCTGRSKTDQVTISESNVTSVNPKPIVTVSFQHVFHADEMCAREIKFNYSGYDSQYRAITSNQQREFVLQLEQGTTYVLTIYLKLADDGETTFWMQEFTTSSVKTAIRSTFSGSNTATFTKGPERTGNEDTLANRETTTKSYILEYDVLQRMVIGISVVAALGIACSLVLTVHCIIKRRLASDADQNKDIAEIQMESTDDMPRGEPQIADADVPNEYEEVLSSPMEISNENETPDQPLPERSGEYEVVRAGNTHDYGKLELE